MKVLLICNGGVSTSILAANIKKYADVHDEIKAIPFTKVDMNLDTYDVILVAPQLASISEDLKTYCKAYKIGMIDTKVYGTMDGKSVLKQAKELYKNHIIEGEEDNMKHLKITLCCNGGVSTKMLCKKIITAAEAKGFEVECDAYSATAIDGAAPGSDIILMGPQIKYLAKSIQERYPDIPVEVIPMQVYGAMNGAKVFEDMMKKYNW